MFNRILERLRTKGVSVFIYSIYDVTMGPGWFSRHVDWIVLIELGVSCYRPGPKSRGGAAIVTAT